MILIIAENLIDVWVTVSDEEDETPNDDNICNEIRRNGLHAVVTVQCNYKYVNAPRRGRYLTIRRKDEAKARYLLQFCEAEVMSCHPGRWGYNPVQSQYDCSHVCDTCSDVPETCRVSDGYCFTGCKNGHWGGNCKHRCTCLDGVACNRTDGSCLPGTYEEEPFEVLANNKTLT